jgi:hypothetical protein
MDRTFEVPHAAAGPLVTPTKPIFNVSFAACADKLPSATAAETATDAIRLFIFSDIFIISHVSKGLRFTHGNSK